MKKVDFNFIINEYNKDINLRGNDCLVYNYFGYVVELSKVNIWFDNYGNYVKPKNFVPKILKQKEKSSCIII